MSSVIDQTIKAKATANKMAALSGALKNAALLAVAVELDSSRKRILEANQQDLIKAKHDKIPQPVIKRLTMDDNKISDVIKGITDLAMLPDPVGRTTYHCEMDANLELFRVTCPIGLIGIIFEARPDALVQISALCLKSSNAVILKGGAEAFNTNSILFELISSASIKAGLPPNWIVLLSSREEVGELLELDKYVDLIIPRGSNAFVRMIMDNTRIPVLGHADGVCHLYIDDTADSQIALRAALDGKLQYTAACNSTETILIHRKIADKMLPALSRAFEENDVRVFGCPTTCERIMCEPVIDWHTEYLDKMISIKVVDSLDEAIEHINTYGSGHTDSIISSGDDAVRKFMSLVDSANVFHNCSTRFSDGFRYGFGAEVGISTSKIHARGPVGLEGLVTYKYKLFGSGQTVADYAEDKKHYKHTISQADCKFDR